MHDMPASFKMPLAALATMNVTPKIDPEPIPGLGMRLYINCSLIPIPSILILWDNMGAGERGTGVG